MVFIKPGNRILENQIADKLNVSKSPIREALKELFGEGLLEIIPNKGVFVKKLTKQDIIDILEFRMIIEKYSIEKTIKRASIKSVKNLNDIIIEMEKAFKDNDTNKYALIDAKFHGTIYKLSRSKLLYKTASNISNLFQPFRVISLNSKKRFDESLTKHKNIINGLVERNFQKTWKIAKKHLELANIEVIKFLETSTD